VVTVTTPLGNFKIARQEDVNDLQLGLPIYPGATRESDSHDNNSVALSFDLPNETNLRIAAAKFTTSDPIGKVQDFYKQQLGGEVTSFTHTDNHGKIVLR